MSAATDSAGAMSSFARVRDWLKAGFAHAGVDPFVGMRLPVLFEQAGFSDVGSLGLQVYWPPKERHAAAYVVGVVRAMKDAIVASGVSPEEDMGLDTLGDRLAEAFGAANAVFTMPTVVGGWGRQPR